MRNLILTLISVLSLAAAVVLAVIFYPLALPLVPVAALVGGFIAHSIRAERAQAERLATYYGGTRFPRA